MNVLHTLHEQAEELADQPRVAAALIMLAGTEDDELLRLGDGFLLAGDLDVARLARATAVGG